jgi:hypothetical protein
MKIEDSPVSETAQSLIDTIVSMAKSGETEDARARAQSQHTHVLQQLLSKNWSELEVIEHQGEMLFPEKLYRRRISGEFEEIPVLVRIPRDPDLRWARVEARRLAIEEKLDINRDADLVEQLETICVMTRCVLNAKAGKDPRTGADFHEPWELDPRQMEKRYDRTCLTQLWTKIDALTHVLDPRAQSMGKEELIAVIAAIAKARNIAPLHVYGPAAQNVCIVSMADLLLSLLASKS